MDSADQMLGSLLGAGINVTSEEEAEIHLWGKGKALRHLTQTFGWDVLKEMLSDYQKGAIEGLLEADETDKEAVYAAFARAKAVNVLISALYSDIDRAIAASEEVPSAIKSNYKRLKSQVPLDSI